MFRSGLPVFETDEDRSYFLTILPIHPFFIKNEAPADVSQPSKAARVRRSREELKAQVVDLLRHRGDMSANEIASALGYKKLTDTLRSVVNEMLDAGEAVYLYPDKPKSSNQKICLLDGAR